MSENEKIAEPPYPVKIVDGVTYIDLPPGQYLPLPTHIHYARPLDIVELGVRNTTSEQGK